MHATSKIEFRIAIDPEIKEHLAYFTLHSLKLKNILSSGTLTPVYKVYNDGTKETTLSWSGHTTKHDYSCKTTEAYLLLPQALSNDAKLTLSYDLAFKD